MKTIRARVTRTGQVELDFGFDAELVDFVKSVSGFGWDKLRRRWVGAVHSLAALQFAAWKHANGQPTTALTSQVQIAVTTPLQAPPMVMEGNLRLHEYQKWGVGQCLSRNDFVLVWSPRVGKTSVAISAGATGIATRLFDRVIVTAPAQVIPEWIAALDKQFPGMAKRELVRGIGYADVLGSHWVLVQHDQITPVAKDLLALANAGKFMFVFDEPQRFSEEKAPRSKTLLALAQHANCDRRVGLTGTPMRNAPDDLCVFFGVFGGLAAKKGSRAWSFLKRYAGAFEGEYGWTTGTPDNLDELAHRLASISHRLTREEVRPDLPAIHRTVRLCEMKAEDSARYKALEAALGKKAIEGKGKARDAALKTLGRTAVVAKMNAVIERIQHHCAERHVKVLIAAFWHETLKDVAEALTAVQWPFYLAGGWMDPNRRKREMEAWKADGRATPLLVNIVASGTGIDLSDADGSVVLEVPWVPSDMLQFEPRILDVHLGKRTTRPWVEYLLTKGTTDEDMALANLKKIAVIDQVVGAERESTGLATSLRESGVVATVDLGLASRSDDAVEAALAGLRARLSGDASVSDLSGMEASELAGAVAEAFEDEKDEDDNDDDFTLADVG